jgi:hypothetical protein
MHVEDDTFIRKIFDKDEIRIMMLYSGFLDEMSVAHYFENKEESSKRLKDALEGRSIIPSKKDMDDFLQRAKKFESEVEAFRLIFKIEDPPEYAVERIEENL